MSVALLLLLISIDFVNTESDNRVITTLKYSKHYVHPSVVNGLPAKDGQVPYLVSLKESLVKISQIKRIWTNLCGGSIIGERKVLTAAHCFEAKNFFYYKHPDHVRVVAGNFTTQLIHTGNTDTTERAQWRRIRRVVLHKKFHFPDNDIAVVFVDTPWKYMVNVGYIVTAKRRTDNLDHCISAGFGSISRRKDETSPVLLIANMFLMPQTNCSTLWEMNMDNFICTYSFMSDVSRGDSGGPLACTLDPAEKKGGELLVGIVSAKNFDKTPLFTRVSAYKDWIARASASGGLKSVAFCVAILKFVLFLLLCFVLPLFLFAIQTN